MSDTENQLASNWYGFSDLELWAAMGYRNEELLLEPLVRAIIICPALLRYLFANYNSNQIKVPEEDVTDLENDLAEWNHEIPLEPLWTKVFGLLVRLRIMVGQAIKLLKDYVKITENGKEMKIRDTPYAIGPMMTNMAKKWREVISEAKTNRPDNQYGGISLFEFVQNEIAGIRNDRLHPTVKSLNEKLTASERTGLIASYKLLIASGLPDLHHDPAKVKERMRKLYLAADERTRLMYELKIKNEQADEEIQGLLADLVAVIRARNDVEEANTVLTTQLQHLNVRLVSVQQERDSSTPGGQTRGRGIAWSIKETEDLTTYLAGGGGTSDAELQKYIKDKGLDREVGAVRSKAWRIQEEQKKISDVQQQELAVNLLDAMKF